ncbi:peptidoglycan bridge formation glycyltransferase FemA/FemB family protein [Clostridium sp. 'deep sea']|uniref:lipid II:glycine glycyltransferase FemX n=1 Tax=Clostridium sp. 'deep sea' TaxID=2779445 RepID=UPI001896872F|nr:peptidoglycan bridge formation glycyltransferase FemA/FemB family protein [Clostridium sp. 'deep sea']QOR34699.1 peptidoglycan bridge formation glycyltransferase FemA/FemB family protein [Clostridium sp. 'deep sea']
MKFIEINENNKKQYNDYIKESHQSHVYQLYEWGELKNETNWVPYRYMVYDGDTAKAAISLLKKRIPAIGKYFFYAPRGPVCSLTDYETMDFLWENISKIAKQQHVAFLKIDPGAYAGDEELHNYLTSRDFKHIANRKDYKEIQPKFVHRLAVNKDEDRLLAEMSSKTRYNIRYAAKKGVVIKDDCSIDDLKEFYRLLKITANRDNFGARGYEYYVNMWNHLVKNGYGKLFMAEYEGTYIAGAFNLICGNKVWYAYGASDNKMRNKQPNSLVQWTMIKWAIENNCDIYDFGGVSGFADETHPMYGVYRFKKGFGGGVTEFIGEYDLVFSKLHYSMWDKLMPFAIKKRAQILKLLRR